MRKEPKGFARNYKLTMEEYKILRKLESHPDLVDDLKDWDRICGILSKTTGSKFTQSQHDFIEKYEFILET